MCQLPRTQPKSVALTKKMIAGFMQYPQTFPSADISKLEDSLNSFLQARDFFNSAESAYRQAGTKQKQVFEQLKSVISSQVKAAQADTADNPVKLGLIFGKRKKKSSANLPAQPFLMDAKPLADTVVKLQWKKNSRNGCGPVKSFIIESRTINNGDSIDWTLTATSFDCQIILRGQPKNVKLEYRVIAANYSGRSIPSNTVCVVL